MLMGGTLTVGTLLLEMDGQRLIEIHFKDTGSGISKKNMEKVFAPFFTTKQTGTGLGLSVVKKVMEIHSGQVDIKSRLGKGTIVTLRIPELNNKCNA